MTYAARIILDSIGPNGARLTTFEVTMPRIVLAEFNTHRMFSRNSASSRAIPVEKMLARVKEHPFFPAYWGKNQKGMQADVELTSQEQDEAAYEWSRAADEMIARAEKLRVIGVHKQITNRLLEPFMWHTVVFTATELTNFFALRDSRMAAPEIQKPAHLIVEAYENSKPMQLRAGEWHLPFVAFQELLRGHDGEWFGAILPTQEDWIYWAKVSAARCARVSYLTHEGKRDPNADVELYERLVSQGHMSPLEHPAMALTELQWRDQAREAAQLWAEQRIPVGNFWGWRQLRKELSHEHDFSLLQPVRQ